MKSWDRKNAMKSLIFSLYRAVTFHCTEPRLYDIAFSTCNVQKSSEKKEKLFMFQSSWLEQYKWLVYSPSQQGGYCKHCVLFPPKVSRITPGVLVALPMQKCNKATGRQGYLALHDQGQYHKDAVMLSLAFWEVPMGERTAPPPPPPPPPHTPIPPSCETGGSAPHQ